MKEIERDLCETRRRGGDTPSFTDPEGAFNCRRPYGSREVSMAQSF